MCASSNCGVTSQNTATQQGVNSKHLYSPFWSSWILEHECERNLWDNLHEPQKSDLFKNKQQFQPPACWVLLCYFSPGGQAVRREFCSCHMPHQLVVLSTGCMKYSWYWFWTQETQLMCSQYCGCTTLMRFYPLVGAVYFRSMPRATAVSWSQMCLLCIHHNQNSFWKVWMFPFSIFLQAWQHYSLKVSIFPPVLPW